jgi:magnesium transporter
MRGLLTKRSGKTGLPPGTLIHIGQPRTGPIRLRLFEYDPADCHDRALASAADCVVPEGGSKNYWLDVGGIHQVSVIEQLGQIFHLHPLMLEDVVNTDQRPKADAYGDYLFLVIKMLRVGDQGDSIAAEQVSLVLGPQFVISFQENGGDVFDPIRTRLKNPKGRLRNSGPDYLAYALLDAIVDNYFAALEHLGEQIQTLEDELLRSPEPATLRAIHTVKRDLLFLRRAVWPVREMINTLERGESDLITDSTKVYLRDVYDHTVQVMDTLETFREMTTGMLDLYLSSVSHRLNAVMKVLTIIATIFMPLTFIAGVYGMNFDYMPELRWHWGYPAVLAVMALVGGTMLWIFRRKDWL